MSEDLEKTPLVDTEIQRGRGLFMTASPSDNVPRQWVEAEFARGIERRMNAAIVRLEDVLRQTEAGKWLPILEMFSEKEVLLHGAAGEDAMNVSDVIKLVRELAVYQLAQKVSYRSVYGDDL